MLIHNHIDCDRLHAAVIDINSGLPSDDPYSRTLAYVYLMLGEVVLGDANNTYLYVAPEQIIVTWAMREFTYLVMQEYGREAIIRMSDGIVQTTYNQRFIFVSAPQVATHTRGISINRAFYDVQPSVRKDLREIYVHIVPNGDIL